MPDDFKEKLNQIDMEDYLIDRGVDFRTTHGSSGTQLNLKECPRCGGSRWKVYINAEKGLGNCFHGDCEATFNKYTFIRSLENEDNRATMQEIDRYCRDVGWRPKRRQVVTRQAVDVVLPSTVSIKEGSTAYRYLFRRGFDASISDYFGWTYCENGSFVYSLSESETERRQDYSGRIIVPIYDLDGELKTFQGRDITDTKSQKYLFPPGLAGSGRFLYNAYNCKEREHIIMTEGVMDVAAVYLALGKKSEPGVLASFGKTLSVNDRSKGQDQLGDLLRLKRQGLRKITIMWDCEAKAREAALRTALLLNAKGFLVKLAILPEGKDPNEVPPKTVLDAIRDAVQINLLTANKLKIQWAL